MTEKELMQGLIDAANVAGWLVYHTHDSRRSAPGFPDLVLLRGSDIAFVECKAAKGRLTVDQKRWLGALEDLAEYARTHEFEDGFDRIKVGIANPDTYDSWLAYIMGSKA